MRGRQGAHGALALPRPARATLPASALAGAAALAATLWLSLTDGGYFATAWGWAGLALLWLATVALILRHDARLGRPEAALLAALGALWVWALLSAAWSESPGAPVLEAERMLVYLGGTAAVFLVATRGSESALLAGLLVGITLACGFGLATRLFPGTLRGYDPVNFQLAEPLGYSNALGILAALGALLALGFAARARAPGRALAGGSLVVLVPTLYFSFGRSAWAGLVAGLAAAVLLDRRRLELVTTVLALGPACALAVWLSSRAHALTHQHQPLAAALRDGHRLAAAIGALALAAAATAAVLPRLARRVRVPPLLRRAYAAALVAAAAAAVALAVERYGAPWTLAARGYDSFSESFPATEGDLNRRLFTFSGNYREQYWPVAWRDVREHPMLGSGAGSYERYWLRHRPTAQNVRDAHSLYLETLAELGPVGLALLVGALAVPLATAARLRRHPLVPAAAGAYTAYLLHAAVQWDWEMPAVTLAALFSGGAVLVAARPDRAPPLSRQTRLAGIAFGAALSGFALVGLVGNGALAASAEAAAAGDWARAKAQARKAAAWAPWSSEPQRWLADAQLALGERAAALTTLRRAAAKDPSNWELWFGLAVAADGRERREALARAARLNPLAPEIAALRASSSP